MFLGFCTGLDIVQPQVGEKEGKPVKRKLVQMPKTDLLYTFGDKLFVLRFEFTGKLKDKLRFVGIISQTS
jgi:hypothetical protein